MESVLPYGGGSGQQRESEPKCLMSTVTTDALTLGLINYNYVTVIVPPLVVVHKFYPPLSESTNTTPSSLGSSLKPPHEPCPPSAASDVADIQRRNVLQSSSVVTGVSAADVAHVTATSTGRALVVNPDITSLKTVNILSLGEANKIHPENSERLVETDIRKLAVSLSSCSKCSGAVERCGHASQSTKPKEYYGQFHGPIMSSDSDGESVRDTSIKSQNNVVKKEYETSHNQPVSEVLSKSNLTAANSQICLAVSQSLPDASGFIDPVSASTAPGHSLSSVAAIENPIFAIPKTDNVLMTQNSLMPKDVAFTTGHLESITSKPTEQSRSVPQVSFSSSFVAVCPTLSAPMTITTSAFTPTSQLTTTLTDSVPIIPKSISQTPMLQAVVLQSTSGDLNDHFVSEASNTKVNSLVKVEDEAHFDTQSSASTKAPTFTHGLGSSRTRIDSPVANLNQIIQSTSAFEQLDIQNIPSSLPGMVSVNSCPAFEKTNALSGLQAISPQASPSNPSTSSSQQVVGTPALSPSGTTSMIKNYSYVSVIIPPVTAVTVPKKIKKTKSKRQNSLPASVDSSCHRTPGTIDGDLNKSVDTLHSGKRLVSKQASLNILPMSTMTSLDGFCNSDVSHLSLRSIAARIEEEERSASKGRVSAENKKIINKDYVGIGNTLVASSSIAIVTQSALSSSTSVVSIPAPSVIVSTPSVISATSASTILTTTSLVARTTPISVATMSNAPSAVSGAVCEKTTDVTIAMKTSPSTQVSLTTTLSAAPTPMNTTTSASFPTQPATTGTVIAPTVSVTSTVPTAVTIPVAAPIGITVPAQPLLAKTGIIVSTTVPSAVTTPTMKLLVSPTEVALRTISKGTAHLDNKLPITSLALSDLQIPLYISTHSAITTTDGGEIKTTTPSAIPTINKTPSLTVPNAAVIQAVPISTPETISCATISVAGTPSTTVLLPTSTASATVKSDSIKVKGLKKSGHKHSSKHTHHAVPTVAPETVAVIPITPVISTSAAANPVVVDISTSSNTPMTQANFQIDATTISTTTTKPVLTHASTLDNDSASMKCVAEVRNNIPRELAAATVVDSTIVHTSKLESLPLADKSNIDGVNLSCLHITAATAPSIRNELLPQEVNNVKTTKQCESLSNHSAILPAVVKQNNNIANTRDLAVVSEDHKFDPHQNIARSTITAIPNTTTPTIRTKITQPENTSHVKSQDALNSSNEISSMLPVLGQTEAVHIQTGSVSAVNIPAVSQENTDKSAISELERNPIGHGSVTLTNSRQSQLIPVKGAMMQTAGVLKPNDEPLIQPNHNIQSLQNAGDCQTLIPLEARQGSTEKQIKKLDDSKSATEINRRLGDIASKTVGNSNQTDIWSTFESDKKNMNLSLASIVSRNDQTIPDNHSIFTTASNDQAASVKDSKTSQISVPVSLKMNSAIAAGKTKPIVNSLKLNLSETSDESSGDEELVISTSGICVPKVQTNVSNLNKSGKVTSPSSSSETSYSENETGYEEPNLYNKTNSTHLKPTSQRGIQPGLNNTSIVAQAIAPKQIEKKDLLKSEPSTQFGKDRKGVAGMSSKEFFSSSSSCESEDEENDNNGDKSVNLEKNILAKGSVQTLDMVTKKKLEISSSTSSSESSTSDDENAAKTHKTVHAGYKTNVVVKPVNSSCANKLDSMASQSQGNSTLVPAANQSKLSSTIAVPQKAKQPLSADINSMKGRERKKDNEIDDDDEDDDDDDDDEDDEDNELARAVGPLKKEEQQNAKREVHSAVDSSDDDSSDDDDDDVDQVIDVNISARTVSGNQPVKHFLKINKDGMDPRSCRSASKPPSGSDDENDDDDDDDDEESSTSSDEDEEKGVKSKHNDHNSSKTQNTADKVASNISNAANNSDQATKNKSATDHKLLVAKPNRSASNSQLSSDNLDNQSEKIKHDALIKSGVELDDKATPSSLTRDREHSSSSSMMSSGASLGIKTEKELLLQLGIAFAADKSEKQVKNKNESVLISNVKQGVNVTPSSATVSTTTTTTMSSATVQQSKTSSTAATGAGGTSEGGALTGATTTASLIASTESTNKTTAGFLTDNKNFDGTISVHRPEGHLSSYAAVKAALARQNPISHQVG